MIIIVNCILSVFKFEKIVDAKMETESKNRQTLTSTNRNLSNLLCRDALSLITDN